MGQAEAGGQGSTHDLGVRGYTAAVGGGEGGGTGLTVPGHVALLGGAAHRERVDAVGVAVRLRAGRWRGDQM